MPPILVSSVRDFKITETKMLKNLVDKVHSIRKQGISAKTQAIFLKRTKWKC